MQRTFLLSFLLLCLPVMSWSLDYDGIIGKSYGERNEFFSEHFYGLAAQGDSVAVFKRINEIKVVAKKHNDEELLLEADYLRLNFLSSRGYKIYIPEIKNLMKRADQQQILQLQIRTRQALGFHYYYEKQDYGYALFWFLKSYDFLEKIKLEDFPEKGEALLNIANVCYAMSNHFQALEFAKEAKKYSYYKRIPNLKYNIWNTEALLLQRTGKELQAETIFKQIYYSARKSGVYEWELIAFTNLMNSYLREENFEDAEKFLTYENLSLLRSRGLDFKPIDFVAAEIFIAQNNWNRVEEHIKGVFDYRDIKTNWHPYQRSRLLRFLGQYAAHNGDYQQAYALNDSSTILMTAYIEMKSKAGVKSGIENKTLERLLKRENDLKEERRQKKLWNLGFTFFIIILSSFGIWYFSRKKRSYIKEIEEKETELQQKEDEIEQARAYIQEFRKTIAQKNKMLEQLVHSADKEQQESISNMMILTKEDWMRFKKEFSALQPLFFENLNNYNEKITPAMERLSALLFVELNDEEIARILGIGKESVLRSKRRLRDYLDIPQATDFKKWYHQHFNVSVDEFDID